MSMTNTDSFYAFLQYLAVNKDGSFDYDIKNRMLDKYKKKIGSKEIHRRALSIFNPNKKEVA